MTSSPSPLSLPFILGLDIASLSFAARLLHHGAACGAAVEFANTASGYQQCRHWLSTHGASLEQTHVVMEATGVYWEECALFFHAARARVNVVNPSQVKAFARTTLARGKTDLKDADLIARFASSVALGRWEPPSLELEALQLIMRQREAYLGMMTQEKNRLHALERRPAVPRAVVKTVQKHIAFLQKHVAELENSFKSDLQKYPQWQHSFDLLQSIPGIGFVTAAHLLCETGGLTSFCKASSGARSGARALTAYAGIAPCPCVSGTSVRRPATISKIGNARLRRALSMAALSAARVESPLRIFYLRLRDKGKPLKVALVALARKLLVLALAVVRSQQRFDPHFNAS